MKRAQLLKELERMQSLLHGDPEFEKLYPATTARP